MIAIDLRTWLTTYARLLTRFLTSILALAKGISFVGLISQIFNERRHVHYANSEGSKRATYSHRQIHTMVQRCYFMTKRIAIATYQSSYPSMTLKTSCHLFMLLRTLHCECMRSHEIAISVYMFENVCSEFIERLEVVRLLLHYFKVLDRDQEFQSLSTRPRKHIRKVFGRFLVQRGSRFAVPIGWIETKTQN